MNESYTVSLEGNFENQNPAHDKELYDKSIWISSVEYPDMWLSTSEARKYVRNNNLNSATDVKHIMWYGYTPHKPPKIIRVTLTDACVQDVE